MAKNKRRAQTAAQPIQKSVQPWAGISPAGWKVIAAGAGTAAAGFFILTFTDPAGQNWASNLSPFLILGGYGIIAAGILKK